MMLIIALLQISFSCTSFCLAQSPVDEMFGRLQRQNTLRPRDFNSDLEQKTNAVG